jgi:hypothetical protein
MGDRAFKAGLDCGRDFLGSKYFPSPLVRTACTCDPKAALFSSNPLPQLPLSHDQRIIDGCRGLQPPQLTVTLAPAICARLGSANADAFTAFAETSDVFDPDTARRLRQFIYSAGYLRDPRRRALERAGREQSGGGVRHEASGEAAAAAHRPGGDHPPAEDGPR